MGKESYSYKDLLSNTTIVKHILANFVKAEWATDMDLTNIERIGKGFIDEKEKENGVGAIYKISYAGDEAYVLFLVASQVDYTIALRIVHHICEFYMDFTWEDEEKEFLPLMIPIVLYTGDEEWTAPIQLADLIDDLEGLLKDALPRFEYYKIPKEVLPKEGLATWLNNW